MAKKPLPVTAPAALGSLGDLLRAGGATVASAAPPLGVAVTAPTAGGFDLTRAARLIVRRERKGHGGRTVTVVDGLALPAVGLEALARAMRKALGCGSWVDGGRVVLQGDRPEAAAAWLSRHGARQITRGN